MSDLLLIDKINSLPHPLAMRMFDGSEYELYQVCVDTGLLHIIVCGKLDRGEWSDFKEVIDGYGKVHSVDDFYNEDEEKAEN